MTSPHPPSSLGSCVYTLYLRWSLLHVRWSTLSGWSLVVTGQPLLASSKSCQLISVIFSRRERRAIEAFEKRSSGGGGGGQILFFIFVVKLIFIFIVVEEGLVKLFFTKRAKIFAKVTHSFHIIMWSNVLGWHDSRLVQS